MNRVLVRVASFLLAVVVARIGHGLGAVSVTTVPSTGSIVLAGLVVGAVCGFIAAISTLAGEGQLGRRALYVAALFVGCALLGESGAALTFGGSVLGGMVAGCLGALLVCAGFGGGEGGDDDE